jgi:hypothetical protein
VIWGIARFMAATSDCATRTQAHIAAVTARGPARTPAAGETGGQTVEVVEVVEVMAGTLESRRVDFKCKVCTP